MKRTRLLFQQQRRKIIEPVFANTRAHKGMNRFTLRGREKVNIQWLLYMIVHNLSKIARAERLAIAGWRQMSRGMMRVL